MPVGETGFSCYTGKLLLNTVAFSQKLEENRSFR